MAERLLVEAGVSVLAGTAFGHSATGSLRVSYANSQTNLRRALERMADFLATAGPSPMASAAPGAARPELHRRASHPRVPG